MALKKDADARKRAILKYWIGGIRTFRELGDEIGTTACRARQLAYKVLFGLTVDELTAVTIARETLGLPSEPAIERATARK
jgi:hypothetical protein